ncbi:virion structural protein [Klebsiella phage K64-1]|uniref:virion structural protein n=1 Tax=Klebsiella phage K64-1 TaxID=1439894 RepID=UPI0018A40F12|nr:virion structural protein [Klebsiella phage K64-1]QOE32517.1 hypothetical protein CPT_Muenster_345 [Klebsiella phage Muenster]
MSLNSFNRNYGMSADSREWWGGNNGFVTVVIDLPTDVEVGHTKVTSDGSEEQDQALQTALTNAQYNQFVITSLLRQRAVLVTTSTIAFDTDVVIPSNFKTASANVVAFATSGVDVAGGAGSVAITWIIERQDVFNKQDKRPGAAYDVPVNPAEDLAKALVQAGIFRTKDAVVDALSGTGASGNAAAATAAAVKVRAALPVQL